MRCLLRASLLPMFLSRCITSPRRRRRPLCITSPHLRPLYTFLSPRLRPLYTTSLSLLRTLLSLLCTKSLSRLLLLLTMTRSKEPLLCALSRLECLPTTPTTTPPSQGLATQLLFASRAHSRTTHPMKHLCMTYSQLH